MIVQNNPISSQIEIFISERSATLCLSPPRQEMQSYCPIFYRHALPCKLTCSDHVLHSCMPNSGIDQPKNYDLQIQLTSDKNNR